MTHTPAAMGHQQPRVPPSVRALRGAFTVLFAPFALVMFVLLLPILFAGGVAFTALAYHRGRKDARQLRASLSAERLSDWMELEGQALEQPITIVVDERTVGWSAMNVWWAPEDFRIHNGPQPLED